MGMFSWECLGCGHSILGPYVLTKKNSWMNRAVILTKDGDIHTGDYDGYGRVGTANASELGDVSWWHRSCWELSKKPGYTKPSPNARDQGHFIIAKHYDHVDPLKCKKMPNKEDHGNVHALIPDRDPSPKKSKKVDWDNQPLEVNSTHVDKTVLFNGKDEEGKSTPVAMLTPPIGEDYWLARVRVSPSQAVVCFHKFGTIGVGFQKETDWNTNLPYTSGTKEIFDHIQHNRGGRIPEERCIRAIKLIQEFAHKFKENARAKKAT